MLKKPVLDYFFKPEAIAVIGASPKETSIGFTLLNNLKKDGFPGPIYPINPKHEEILDLKTYSSITQVGSPSIWPSLPYPSMGCRLS